MTTSGEPSRHEGSRPSLLRGMGTALLRRSVGEDPVLRQAEHQAQRNNVLALKIITDSAALPVQPAEAKDEYRYGLFKGAAWQTSLQRQGRNPDPYHAGRVV